MTIIITSIVALTVLGLLFYVGHKFGKFIRDMEERDRYWREIHRQDEEKARFINIKGTMKVNGRDLMIKVILLLLLASPAFGQSFHAKKYRRQASKEVPCPHFKSVYHQPIKSKKEAPGFVTRRKKRVKMRTV